MWRIVIEIVWALVSKLISNAAQKAEWEKKVKQETDKYNAGVKDSAEIRETQVSQRKTLLEKWAAKWGTKK